MKKILILLIIIGTFSFCTKEKITRRAEKNDCRDCRLKVVDPNHPSDSASYVYPENYADGWFCTILDDVKDQPCADYTIECFYKK